MSADLLLAGLAAALLGGATDLLAGPSGRGGRHLALLPYAAALVASACAFAAGVHALSSAPRDIALGHLFGVGRTSLRIGHLAGLFLTLLFGIAVAVSACFISWARRPSTVLSRGLASGYLLLLVSTATVLVAGDTFTFLFAWESLTLSFFLLTSSGRKDARQASASWATLGFGKIGGAALLLGFLLLAGQSGHFTIAAWHQVPPGALHSAAYVLIVIGFGAKFGLVPLQGWIPVGYPAAPGPARAAMAGIAANVGVYGLWRFLGVLGAPPAWLAVAVLLLGGLTALLGIAFAGVQANLSRVIAYSSVENGGIILTAYGVALAGASVGSVELEAIGLLAATLHTVAHAMAKSALFTSSANMEAASGSDHLEALRGSGRDLPLSGATFAVGAIALAALPPTVGFVSEWFVFEALMQQFRLHGLAIRLAMAGAGAMVALTSGLAALAFLRVIAFVVLGRRPVHHPPGAPDLYGAASPRTTPERSLEAGLLGRIGLAMLAVACLAVAALTPWEIRLISTGLSSLVPGATIRQALASPWVLQPIFPHFSILSPSWLWIAMPLAFALVAAAAAVLSQGRYFRPRRVPAWRSATAGIAGPSSYSAFAFANPLRNVLANVLGTRREVELLERPEAHGEDVAAHVEYRSRVIEPVETWIYEPARRAALATARLVRRLQSGRLDAYVGYMAITLVALLALVAALR